MKTGSDLDARVPTITDAVMQANAEAAVARGAGFLDRHYPGWAEQVPAPIVSEVPNSNSLDIPEATVTQLGLVKAIESSPEAPDREAIAELQALLAYRDGELKFDPQLDEADITGLMLAEMLGIDTLPVAAQEFVPENGDQIDMAAHGLTSEFQVVGLGKTGSYRVTEADILDGDGYCKDKAGRFVAEAWNAEIDKRRPAEGSSR